MIPCGRHLFFAAADAQHGFELWASDGSAAGTHLVQDLTPGLASSHISDTSCDDDVLLVRAAHRPTQSTLIRTHTPPDAPPHSRACYLAACGHAVLDAREIPMAL